MRFIRWGVVVAVVLAGVVSAGTPAEAAATRSCSNLTVNGGKAFGRMTLRVKVIGGVTCPKARGVVRSWYHRIAAGKCASGGNFCALEVPGGWSCSIFSAGEGQMAGGASAGCARAAARIRLYPTH